MEMHRNHRLYACGVGARWLDELLPVLDAMEPKSRGEIFQITFIGMGAYPSWVDPAIVPFDDPEVYATFRRKCCKIELNDEVFVPGIVLAALADAFAFADEETLPRAMAATSGRILKMRRELDHADDSARKRLLQRLDEYEKHLTGLPAQKLHWRQLYNAFCDGPLARLVDTI